MGGGTCGAGAARPLPAAIPPLGGPPLDGGVPRPAGAPLVGGGIAPPLIK